MIWDVPRLVGRYCSSQKYQCRHCEKRCSNTADLRKHDLRKHDLRKHDLRKHEDPKFKCSSCEKMLKRKSALLEHERMHTGLQTDDLSSVWKCRKKWLEEETYLVVGGSFMIPNGNNKVFPFARASS